MPRELTQEAMMNQKEPLRCPYADFAALCVLDECSEERQDGESGCWRIREERKEEKESLALSAAKREQR